MIRLDPTAPEAYDRRARLWATCPDQQFRNGKKAVESATKACELSKWNEPFYLDTLAKAYEAVGDSESAEKWQNKAFDLRERKSPFQLDGPS